MMAASSYEALVNKAKALDEKSQAISVSDQTKNLYARKLAQKSRYAQATGNEASDGRKVEMQ